MANSFYILSRDHPILDKHSVHDSLGLVMMQWDKLPALRSPQKFSCNGDFGMTFIGKAADGSRLKGCIYYTTTGRAKYTLPD